MKIVIVILIMISFVYGDYNMCQSAGADVEEYSRKYDNLLDEYENALAEYTDADAEDKEDARDELEEKKEELDREKRNLMDATSDVFNYCKSSELLIMSQLLQENKKLKKQIKKLLEKNKKLEKELQKKKS